MRLEFRVRWQREGCSGTTRIYQTEAAARRKIDAVLALEELKVDTQKWADLPDLVAAPVLETREVGTWRVSDLSVQERPSEGTLTRIAAWAGINDIDDPNWVY